MIKKEYWVKISDEESIPYIKNHFKFAKAELIKIKGKSYNMYLSYDEKDTEKVQKELQELTKYKIIEFGL